MLKGADWRWVGHLAEGGRARGGALRVSQQRMSSHMRSAS